MLTVVDTGVGDGWADAEIRWIAHHRRLVGDRLTNLTDGGEGARGCVRSAETRAKIGAAHKGKKLSDETKERLRESKVGKPLSSEHVTKLSEAHRGLKRSQASVAKSASFWRGRAHTDEARSRVRASHEGLTSAKPKKLPRRSEASRQRTRDALKAHYAEQGTRKMSEEAKEKIRQGVKAYRASKAGVEPGGTKT